MLITDATPITLEQVATRFVPTVHQFLVYSKNVRDDKGHFTGWETMTLLIDTPENIEAFKAQIHSEYEASARANASRSNFTYYVRHSFEIGFIEPDGVVTNLERWQNLVKQCVVDFRLDKSYVTSDKPAIELTYIFRRIRSVFPFNELDARSKRDMKCRFDNVPGWVDDNCCEYHRVIRAENKRLEARATALFPEPLKSEYGSVVPLLCQQWFSVAKKATNSSFPMERLQDTDRYCFLRAFKPGFGKIHLDYDQLSAYIGGAHYVPAQRWFPDDRTKVDGAWLFQTHTGEEIAIWNEGNGPVAGHGHTDFDIKGFYFAMLPYNPEVMEQLPFDVEPLRAELPFGIALMTSA